MHIANVRDGGGKLYRCENNFRLFIPKKI